MNVITMDKFMFDNMDIIKDDLEWLHHPLEDIQSKRYTTWENQLDLLYILYKHENKPKAIKVGRKSSFI